MEYLIIIVLLALSALFSGLTLGLMGMKPNELLRKASLGDAHAARVYRIRKEGNLLLTTLLIGNVLVNAVLSIFLGSLTTGVIAAFVATVLIVIFGEIIPQALFSRHALRFGGYLAIPVQVIVWLMYPVSKPVAYVLDRWLGSELPTIYSKKELQKIIEEHEDAPESALDEDEERIIKGALTFSDKSVESVMTPRAVVEFFSETDMIETALLKRVRDSGLSRFPVLNDQQEVVAILYSAQLIGSATTGAKVGEIAIRDVQFVSLDAHLDTALKMFLKSHKHLYVVKDAKGRFVGVITLEDVLEEIIRTEIIDEHDKYVDMRLASLNKVEN